jgi:hypothetical protein
MAMSRVGSIEFAGMCFVDCQVASTRPPITASSITISRGSLTFVTDSSPLFGTAPSNGGDFDLVICYRRATVKETENLSSLDSRFIHIDEVQIPDSVVSSWTLCIETIESTRCIVNMTPFVRSLVFRGVLNHDYRFPAAGDGVSGYLQSADRQTVFPLQLKYSYVDVVWFVTASAPRTASPTFVFRASTVLGVNEFRPSSVLPSNGGGLSGVRISISDERSPAFISSRLVHFDFSFVSFSVFFPREVSREIWWWGSFVLEISLTNRALEFGAIVSDSFTGSREPRSAPFSGSGRLH